MHQLLVVRHAIAQDRMESMQQGTDDADRPLTPVGRKKMARVTRGLSLLHPEIDTIYTSPLLRAQQTAEILKEHYPSAVVTILKTLSPEHSTAELIHSLRRERSECIAIVGHEPGLSRLIATLICGQGNGDIELKKGGIAQLLFAENIAPGEGILQWLHTPKQLRLLGDSA
jgi:phosphohistidine phosphatase